MSACLSVCVRVRIPSESWLSFCIAPPACEVGAPSTRSLYSSTRSLTNVPMVATSEYRLNHSAGFAVSSASRRCGFGPLGLAQGLPLPLQIYLGIPPHMCMCECNMGWCLHIGWGGRLDPCTLGLQPSALSRHDGVRKATPCMLLPQQSAARQ